MEMSKLDRRLFLRTSVLGTSAALAAPSLLTRLPSVVPEEKNKKPVLRRTLGKTGISLPVVSMGVMRADSPALIRAALDAGIVLFDTANGYQKGRNEEMLGQVLSTVPRSSYVIATKVSPEDIDRQKDTIGAGSTKEAFLKHFDESLRRLKLKSVDILYVHGVSTREQTLFPEMIAAVKEAKKSGKAKFVGVSVHKNMETVIDAAVESGVYDVVLAAINFQYGDPEKFRKATARAAAAGIGVIAMKTMAGGFFDKDKKKQVNCKAALKWVLQDPNITTCIPGMTTFDQLQENCSVNFDLTLTDEEKASLAMRDSGEGMFCDGCSQCSSPCAKRLAIPDLMRAYMYAYGYGATRQAKEVLSEGRTSSDPCRGCPVCTARCVKGFPIRERVSDVSRLAGIPDEFLA
jgi:aryl-alcohol dehydrogenase-like predicted oxidoreductase